MFHYEKSICFKFMQIFAVQAAKEKALQLERKRKAATFLATLAEKRTTVRWGKISQNKLVQKFS